MSFLPDYGLALLRTGVDRDFRSYFYTLQLDHLSTSGRDRFTTLLRISRGGVDYALSFDFSRDILNDVLESAPPACKSAVRDWLLRGVRTHTLELPELVTFGASAYLGEEQRAAKETFVPFIIDRVL